MQLEQEPAPHLETLRWQFNLTWRLASEATLPGVIGGTGG